MAISSVSQTTNTFQASNFASTRQAFNQLTSALKSGDLAAAQSAYATLSQGAQGASGPFSQALNQIGDALQSDDLGKAQQALSQLQQQTQAHRGGGHHHHADNDGDKGTSSPTTATPASASTAATGTTGATVNVTA